MNGDQLRKLALSLPNSSEAPHFDRTAFRTPKRIFATLSADGRSVNLKLDQQAALVESRPNAFQAIAGGWGRQGWTTMTLSEVSAEAKVVLADAHALASLEQRKRKASEGETGSEAHAMTCAEEAPRWKRHVRHGQTYGSG